MLEVPVDKLDDKNLRLFGIPITVLALLLAQMPFFFPGRWDMFWRYALIGITFTGLMWEIARWILVRTRRKYPGLSQTRQRIGWSLFFFTIEVWIGQGLVTHLVFSLKWAATSTKSEFEVWMINFGWSLFFIVVFSGTYEAIYFFSHYRMAIQKAEHLKTRQVQQQLEHLKNRVNPHFLFNSLTTLSALIGEDARRAEQFVDELSKVYRYLLRAGKQSMATLADELQFAESYTALLRSRFETGAFRYRVDPSLGWSPAARHTSATHSTPDRQLPVLSMQNALDYLVRTQNTPLDIVVAPVEGGLLLRCTHQPKVLAFDSVDHDWQQLAYQGAQQQVQDGQFILIIPFFPHPVAE